MQEEGAAGLKSTLHAQHGSGAQGSAGAGVTAWPSNAGPWPWHLQLLPSVLAHPAAAPPGSWQRAGRGRGRGSAASPLPSLHCSGTDLQQKA